MKLALIGSGMIIKDALFALQPLTEVRLMAIFARPHSKAKGEELAETFHIPEVYTDYGKLLDHADIDTVYIGLINSVHYEYAKQALEKKKHVILEKPFTGTYEEAKELADLAEKQNCFIFEAITVLHNDVIIKMQEYLPKLGPIRMMLANYSQYSSRYDRYLAGITEPSFDPACLGGALRDINVYNIHYAAALFGMPSKACYYPNTGHNGIDTSGTLVLKYDSFSAVCTGAKDSDSPCFVSIQGEKGFMKIDGKPNLAPNLTCVYAEGNSAEYIRDPAGGMMRPTVKEEFIPPKPHHRMTQEFRDFAKIIDEKDRRKARRFTEETLTVMKILSDCLM